MNHLAPSLNPIRPDAPAEIPVIDLAAYLAGQPGAREQAAAALRHALENVGFYFVTGHGVDQALVDAAFDAARHFHAGDRVIIAAFAVTDETITPRMIVVDEQNRFKQELPGHDVSELNMEILSGH